MFRAHVSTDLASTACHPGQSYNPAEQDHEEAIDMAVALELKRNAVEAQQRAPLSQGLSEHTLSLLVGDVSATLVRIEYSIVVHKRLSLRVFHMELLMPHGA